MSIFPNVRLIRTPDEHNRVIESAKQDNHELFYPTHLVEKDNVIVGAASVANIPMLIAWNHSKLVSARDSVHLKMVCDSIMETKGFPKYLIACNESSPYSTYMKKLGCKLFWKTELFEGGV